MKSLMVLFFVWTAVACSSGNCRSHEIANETTNSKITQSKGSEAMVQASKADRVKVYKFDGSLQCNQGKAVAAAVMQKELEPIPVFSSQTKNDGMMRIQVCGAPTGNCNVYEIHRKDLEAAQKKGFKEWVAE